MSLASSAFSRKIHARIIAPSVPCVKQANTEMGVGTILTHSKARANPASKHAPKALFRLPVLTGPGFLPRGPSASAKSSSRALRSAKAIILELAWEASIF